MARWVLLPHIMLTNRAARFVVAATLLAAAATPVLADKGIGRTDKTDKNAFPKLNCGESYVLGAHKNQVPVADTQVAKPKSLSDSQIAEVLKNHLEDIQYCWNRLPAKQRSSDASLMLALSVAPKGDVIDKTLVGDAPAEAKSCIARVVDGWTFPAAELASEVEYPVALRAVSVRAR
jgi:hypothetical protein